MGQLAWHFVFVCSGHTHITYVERNGTTATASVKCCPVSSCATRPFGHTSTSPVIAIVVSKTRGHRMSSNMPIAPSRHVPEVYSTSHPLHRSNRCLGLSDHVFNPTAVPTAKCHQATTAPPPPSRLSGFPSLSLHRDDAHGDDGAGTHRVPHQRGQSELYLG